MPSKGPDREALCRHSSASLRDYLMDDAFGTGAIPRGRHAMFANSTRRHSSKDDSLSNTAQPASQGLLSNDFKKRKHGSMVEPPTPATGHLLRQNSLEISDYPSDHFHTDFVNLFEDEEDILSPSEKKAFISASNEQAQSSVTPTSFAPSDYQSDFIRGDLVHPFEDFGFERESGASVE